MNVAQRPSPAPVPSGRRSPARLAPAPAPQPARPRARGRISTRHLSFLETGRSRPSREMLLHLAERLEIPLRERNAAAVAAGYAPVFPERRSTTRRSRRRARRSTWCSTGTSHTRRSPSTGTGRSSPPTRPLRRCSPGSIRRSRAAGQRAAPQPAPGGARAADRQPRGMARRTSWRACAARSTSPPTRR